ncbi:MAG: MtrB/PioB family outer membrane beta-barrel protein [Thermoanaerobaculia bacterium]|nr:MAG: MtrB/PioB family outer membrane beta-barrel protein [Thermoanaerobaculia bacterium]
MNRHRIARSPFATAAAGVALLLVLAPAPILAGEDSGFQFRLDPLVLEGLYLDQDTSSSRFQEYRDLSNGFRLTQMALEGVSADLKRELRFEVVNGGRDDAFYGMTYDVAGSWRLELAYDLIPHRFGNDGHILWQQTAPGVYELPDGMQGALEAFNIANQSRLNFAVLDGVIQPWLATAQSVDLALERHRTRATVELGRGGAANWTVDFQRERRSGNRAFGASFGFNNVTELPEPIEYDTTQATMAGTWRWSSGILSAGYRYSTFENDVSTLYWDNPWRLTDSTHPSAYSAPGTGSVQGAARGFADLAADNDSGALFASGRFDFGTAGWLNVAADWIRYRQDDDLLPFTLNTSIGVATGAPFEAWDPANQPYGSADRESEMLKLVAAYGTRFGDGWQLGVRYDYQDYTDDSERFEWEGYVRYHAVWEEIARITVPYSWNRAILSASLDKDFGAAGTFGLELKRTEWDREFRETEGTTEDVVALTWDARFGHTIWRAKYETGERDIDGHYEPEAAEASYVVHGPLTTQEGLRRFDQAARSLDRWNLSVAIPFAETWNLTLRGNGAENDYDESEFGLLDEELFRYGFDLSWEVGAASSLHFWGERAQRDIDQLGRQSGATPSTNPLDDWSVEFEEINDTWGLGWNREAGGWTGQLNGWWSKSDGLADIFSPEGGSPNLGFGFDNYEDYEILSFEGILDYELTKNLTVGGRILYEDFTIDSFIRQDLRNYLPGALLIFADDGEYQAWSAGLRMTLRL